MFQAKPLWQEIGSYKALSGRRSMHSPTHTGLETEFKAEPHSNETIVERVAPLHLPPEIFGSLFANVPLADTRKAICE